MRRGLVFFGICCFCALAPLRAQQRDLRLLEAVKRRDAKAFAALLRAKADVNAAQPDGATALTWAVHLGERGMAEALLDSGRDDEAREWFAKAGEVDPEGETDAGDRLAALDGLTFEDVDADDDEDEIGDEPDEDGDEVLVDDFEDEDDEDLDDEDEDEDGEEDGRDAAESDRSHTASADPASDSFDEEQ
jgi:ankyrin repeat protein